MNLIGYDDQYKFLLTKEQIQDWICSFQLHEYDYWWHRHDQLKDKYIN